MCVLGVCVLGVSMCKTGDRYTHTKARYTTFTAEAINVTTTGLLKVAKMMLLESRSRQEPN